MRKLTCYIAASLDGYIARRDGTVDWLPGPEAGEDYGYAAFLAGIDTVVMGRKTWDLARTVEGERPFGGRRCIVFSRRRAGLRQGRVQFTDEDPETCLRRLRERRGGGVWLVGGGEIVRLCLEAGIVNELILTLVPVLLGDGLPLFLPRGGTTWLRLRESRPFPNGLLQLRYVPAGVARQSEPPLPEPAVAEPVCV